MVAAQRQTELSLRRAAILLSHLDAENRRRLLAHFPAPEASRLRAAAAALADVDPLEVHRVVTSFVGRVTSARQAPSAGDAHTSAAQTSAAQTAAAQSRGQAGEDAQPAAQADGEQAGLKFLNRVSDVTLLKAVESEHPQTVAVVLASLEPQQAARLLKRLDANLRREAIRRLGRLQDIPREVIEDIGRHLQQLIGALEPVEATQGRRTLVSILGALDDSDRASLIGGLADADGVLASALAECDSQTGRASRSSSESAAGYFVADDTARTHVDGAGDPEHPLAEHVLRLDAAQTPGTQRSSRGLGPGDADRGGGTGMADQEQIDAVLESLKPRELQSVLAQLESRQALLTLCGLSSRAVKRLMRSLPRRQAKEIRQRMDGIGSLEMREIEAAKQLAAREALDAYGQTDVRRAA